MKKQADYQRTSFATCTTRLLDRPADYVRTHCSQSWDRECVPNGDKCQNFRRARQCVALKSIKLDGKVVPLLRAWAPLQQCQSGLSGQHPLSRLSRARILENLSRFSANLSSF